MLRDRMQQNGSVCVAAAVALAFVALAVLPQSVGANTISDKLKRQIRVMEEVVDEVLVESPYLLVYSSDPTHGFYVDEFGAIFSFEASLVGGKWNMGSGLAFLENLHIESEDGRTVIWVEGDDEGEHKVEIVTKDDDEDEDEDEYEEQAEQMKVTKDLEKMKAEKKVKEEECYASGKEELIESLVDYGETLTGLRDDQWVAITAFLKNADLFKKHEISRLVLKVRVRDLRDHAHGDLSRDNLFSRVMVEEY
ncbi:MAG: hypothetical protein GF330_10860 [Candidatus Eisenbacteria bacterium]|nr:hypothetical protein [Candidatus Eisenbacteria bacterium]